MSERRAAFLAVPRTIPEAGLLWRICAEATEHGWSWLHIPDSRRLNPEAAGWVDLFLTHPESPLALAWEVKTELGRVRPEQRRWLADLDGRTIRSAVVRPSDWELIARVLAR